MKLLDLTQKQPQPGGLVARVLPDCVHIHTWAGDTELIARLSPAQASRLSDVLKSRLGNFVASGIVKRTQIPPCAQISL